ncbi:MAG: hypothetical protein HOP18_10285 [Deltaproteobacteria bacterium]|nr:hypothetical protein [Deltaproteobacteria bacterium]
MVFSRSLRSLFFLVLLSTGLFVCGFPATGWAQDADADGIPDAHEAGIGGNPLRKDVFVECAYMRIDLNGDGDGLDRGEHTHRMGNAAVQQLIQTFANAPVTNPGGVCRGGPKNGLACSSTTNCNNFPCSFTGITFHLDQNQALPDQRFLDFTNKKEGRDFFDLKATHFNFAARAPYYHYCILAHNSSIEMGSASGQGEIFGNDFMTTLGGWASETGLPVGTVGDQVGTFLHELGHNFGLEHGGGSPLAPDARVENYKPNYISVMNYFFQVSGIRRAGVPPRFDFSRTQLPTLNENALNEMVGIQGGLDRTRFFCPNFELQSAVGSGPIDWNCSSSLTTNAVANPNADRTFRALPLRDTLEGYNDWSNLRLNFRTSPVYDASAGAGFGQHQRYLGAYKPATMTAGHGIDREPEATLRGGRCKEFLTLSQTPTSQGIVFRTHVFSQRDDDGNDTGNHCEQ